MKQKGIKSSEKVKLQKRGSDSPPPSPDGPGPLQCYQVGPSGDLSCSWEPVGDVGHPTVLHLQSQKYHPNRTQTVAVPEGQSQVTVSRKHLTRSDQLLVWGTQAGRPLWPPVFVDLETQMRPDAPDLLPEVDLSEDEPLEAAVQWVPPVWPPNEVLTCQFYYRRCQEAAWTLLEQELKSVPLSPVEIPDLDLAAAYRVRGRCRLARERGPWSAWSRALTFRTPPSAPGDVWVSGNLCEAAGRREALLVWKPVGPCVQVSYRVWFWGTEKPLAQEGIPCCQSSIPTWAQRAEVSAVTAPGWVPRANLSFVCLAPDLAPRDVQVSSSPGSLALLVTWHPGDGQPWEYVVAWAEDEKPLDNVTWMRRPPGNLSALLPGNFTGGVPYQVMVTAVFPGGLAPAPSVWGFKQELAPTAGPALWRLQDDPPGTPAVAWGEVPRRQLRGRLSHYTVCAQSRLGPLDCVNVSSSTQTITLPDLRSGPCKLWVTASTTAGQGPPGPSLQLHLPAGYLPLPGHVDSSERCCALTCTPSIASFTSPPKPTDNTLNLRFLSGVLCLWGLLLLGSCLGLATAGRCHHIQHKMLPHWILEKVPDPANSHSGQPHIQELPPPQPLVDLPTVEVEEVEPEVVGEPLQVPALLHSGYEKHFMPTPEELGLLGPPVPHVLA
ncbi:interleukin-27 receptor subunit alpha [Ctenodactylus gundi]